ncbi:MAG: deoxyribonuclease IV [Patescibacteria group bacterium]|nr:deoxyribonuclease IV [Patescibacteria group bacterium]
MKLGAHVSISGGLYRAVERAVSLGSQTFQIFGSSPRSFNTINYSEEDFERFRRAVKSAKMAPIFFHGVYLINLGSPNKTLFELSIKSLIFYLNLCQKAAAQGVIFHLGSHHGQGFDSVKKRVVEAVKTVLAQTEAGLLIFENNAGQGGGIGTRFEELAELVSAADSSRTAVCLDTQHAFAAGYPINLPQGLDDVINKLQALGLLKKLVAVHTNDSKFPLGSLRDRHENIGRGFIGLDGFKNILNHPLLKELPFIIETPGFDNKGPDKKNLEILRGLVG